jgi:hypothetical protein
MKSPTLLAAALLLAGLAQADEPAPNADRRALNAAVQRDAKGNQSAAASVSLPVGRSAWVQAGVGQSRSRDAASGNRYKPTQASIGGGMAGKGWQASLNAAALDWKPTDNVNLGLDAAHRDARARGTLPAAGGGAATPAEQRVKGHGVGVHGAVAVTQRLTVYGATMRNHYKTSTTQTAPSNGGLLAPLLPNRVSAINRDEAALARSHQLGATYRVTDRVALNGEVLQDRLLDGGNLRSAQVKAAIDAGAGWTLTPGIGRSRGPQGGVNYGSLAASYAW